MKTRNFVGQSMAEHVFWWFVMGGLIVTCIPSAVAQRTGDGIVDIGNRNQVFIDGRYMDCTEGCRIVVCPPRKTYGQCRTTTLRGRLPWNPFYVTILPVDGTFRGFHALSKDGATWRRVEPGTAPEPDDLLGLYGSDGVVFEDPTAAPEERYKLYNGLPNRISVSSDGAAWRLLYAGIFPDGALFPRGMDAHNKCFYDTRLGKYVAYVRVNKAYPAPPERQAYFTPVSKRNFGCEGFYYARAIGRSVTEDLSSFPMPEVVFEFDDQDPHFGGVSVTDFYMPEVVQYPHAQDAYYLFNSRYLHYEDWYLYISPEDMSNYDRDRQNGPTGGPLNTGPVDMALAASRDGINWHRFDRKPWIPLGPEGSFDAGQLYPCAGMFSHGDEIWIYYIATAHVHGSGRRTFDPTMSRVVLLKDRFTAVEADYTGGEFTTCPVRFEGETLHINVETSALGLARVEIQDADGNPMEGFGLDDCDRIHTANTVDRVVTWRRGESDVSALAGQPIRLRFELQSGAKLYAFRFGAG